VAGEFVDPRHVNQRTADELPGREADLQSPVSEHRMSVSDRKAFSIRAMGENNKAARGRLVVWFAKLKFWSGRRDSNPRPRPWQGRALPLSYTRIRDAGGDGAPSTGRAMPNAAPECNSPRIGPEIGRIAALSGVLAANQPESGWTGFQRLQIRRSSAN
jgi:hypothetical protein